MITVIIGLAALVGCTFGVYKYEKKKILSKIKKAAVIDIDFVRNWIVNQDLEKYNKSYTAVMLRGKEIPNFSKLKLFFDSEKIVALCIYDKNGKSVVTKDIFLAKSVSNDFGSDDFIEFPFE